MSFRPEQLVRDYGDPEGEARACRRASALFDFSFLERARLEGSSARTVLERMTGRPLTGLEPGQICYALRTDEDGNLISDLTIWRDGDTSYELMSGRREDVAYLLEHAHAECRVLDLTRQSSVFAVQGPTALDALLRSGASGNIAALQYFRFCRARIGHIECVVARLGYTGEPGFEVVLDRAGAAKLWDVLAQHSRQAGFIAADMLRIEAGFVLFTNEFRLPVTPAEAGLTKFIERSCPARCPAIRLVCFRATTDHKPALWRASDPLQRPADPNTITVTSACHSLCAGGALGLGYICADAVEASFRVADPSGIFRDVRLTSLPFYDSSKRRPRLSWNALV